MTTATIARVPRTTSELAEYYESIYVQSEGDLARIPWADGHPCSAMVTWLDIVAPSLLRCGSRVAVVGCGLGDDARELLRRGYDVTAFDVSSTAIRMAKELDPDHAGCYHRECLFETPARWHHRFDLVVEINTIQSLCPAVQSKAVGAIGRLASMRGSLLVICRASELPVREEDGPPWALTQQQLCEYAAAAGFEPDGSIDVFEDDETPPVIRMRALFRRS